MALAATRPKRLAVWGAGFGALTLAVLAGLWVVGSGPPPPKVPLSAERAQLAALRAEAAFADAERVWAARFPAELGRDYPPAQLRHFSRLTETPCAGAEAAAGPFYCAATGMVATDLAFLDGLGRRLRADAERASATFVARASAAHAQAVLGPAAGPDTGDCLAGVWARDAEPRIGAVSPDLYGRMLVSAREVAQETDAPAAGWRDAALFAPGARAGRQAAFARGLEAGTLAACLGP